MLMNRVQGVEPVTMCLVCLRPALQHGCWFNCYPVLTDWMNTVYDKDQASTDVLPIHEVFTEVSLSGLKNAKILI